MTVLSIIILLAAGAAVLIAAAVGIGLFLAARHDSTDGNSDAKPLPGGGGIYVMKLEGMSCEHCKASVEAALNAIGGVEAYACLKTGTVQVKYAGVPDLSLLDTLKKAAEDAGFTVTDIQ